MKRSFELYFLAPAAMLFVTASVVGQTPPAAPSQTAGPVVADARTTAPQVVTIVHRLNGIKLMRLLSRLSGNKNTVATLNETFAISDEVHTKILAGLALDDGRTIVAWLPQAEAELETSFFGGKMVPPSPPKAVAGPTVPGVAPLPPASSDLTVLARDGNELRARYVGLDGPTGISVLRISGLNFALPPVAVGKVSVAGQRLRLFAPEGVSPKQTSQTTALGRVYVRVGNSEATVAQVRRSESGNIERLIARGINLMPAIIGGIAIDEAGLTVGIVESINANEASIIPLETIRVAAKRVIERQSSVPRPLLGVHGEGIGFVPRAQMVSNGWQPDEATALMGKRLGIMLTAVVPGTPAAQAHLRPGDVILRVNEHEVRSVQDFSMLLGQCEVAVPVKFTVARPNHPTPQAITVKLTEAFNFVFQMEGPLTTGFQPNRPPRPPRTTPADSLANLGMETLAFAPRAAARLRAQSGLLVVRVNPEGLAYRNGVREGDLIETIDDRRTLQRSPETGPAVESSQTIVLGIVRNGQKIQVTIQKQDQKQPDQKQ